MRRKRKFYDCVEYLSVDAPLDSVDYLEDKQSKCIHEYVRNKEYSIVGKVRRQGFSQPNIDRQWNAIVNKIRKKQIDGVVLVNMDLISIDLPDALYKIGQVTAAGGVVVTVEQGKLDFKLERFKDGTKQ